MESVTSLRKECIRVLQGIRNHEQAARKFARNHGSALPPHKEVLLVNLILLHVPWQMIVFILFLATKSYCKVPRMPLNMADLKKIAMNKILDDPSLLTQMNDNSNPHLEQDQPDK